MRYEKTIIAIIDNGINKDQFEGELLFDISVNDLGEIEEEYEQPEIFLHGTYCAMIIKEIFPECILGSVAILDGFGKGTFEKLVIALKWCSEHNAKIINLSLGTTCFQDKLEMQKLVNQYAMNGMCFVAAGTNRDYTITYPASFTNVLGVEIGKKFDLSTKIDLGLDFQAPCEKELIMKDGAIKIDFFNSYACPYITAIVGKIVQIGKINNICSIKCYLYSLFYKSYVPYFPDWIYKAYIYEDTSGLEKYENFDDADTVIVKNVEVLRKVASSKKHIVYLGKENNELQSDCRFFWSRNSKIKQIFNSRIMNKKITIPIITFEVENPIEYIRYAYYLKKVLMNEGYNIYIITFIPESILCGMEFLPEEILERDNFVLENYLVCEIEERQYDAILLVAIPMLTT